MQHVPSWYAIALLALAAFRTWRLVAVDVITRPIRERLIGRTEERHGHAEFVWPTYRAKLDELVHCPWCLGWWIGLGWWAAWLVWPSGTLIASVPFALNAFSALVAKNLDE